MKQVPRCGRRPRVERSAVFLGALLLSTLALGAEPAEKPAPAVAPALPGLTPARPAAGPPEILPAGPGECALLPKPRSGPPPFPSGEVLDYDVDVVGVRAGKMVFSVLPASGRGAAAEIPVRVVAESNTFFNKVRKVRAEITSWLRPRDLRPRRFKEDLNEGPMTRLGDVTFPNGGPDRIVDARWTTPSGGGGAMRGRVVGDALDYVGAIFLFRAIPLRVGQEFCFEAYAIRRLWRVVGKVESREHVSTPAGEFEAFHLSGVATKVGGGRLKREVHVWISDDDRRLPIAAIGVIDLGPVRATLTSVTRPDFKAADATAGKPLEW